MKERPTCCVVDSDCDAPANLQNESLPRSLPTCGICGESVCRKCSTVRKDNQGKVRMCNNCERDRDGTDIKQMARALRRGGPGSTAAGYDCIDGGAFTWNGGPITKRAVAKGRHS